MVMRAIVSSKVVAGGGFPGPQGGPEALLNHRPLGYEPSGLPGCPTPLPIGIAQGGFIKPIDERFF